MPLHLLGKKSWNVYNQENISRVKRDQAQAKALEEEDERRMQEVDAERRIQILRGELPSTPPPPPASHPSSEPLSRPERKLTDDAGRLRKRRRIAGEDDTDRDIRYAREDAAYAKSTREKLTVAPYQKDKASEVPLVDGAGHINLFQDGGKDRKAEKNKEAEADAEKNKRSYEDQYTMRFSNAAGFKQSIGNKPWYSSSAQAVEAPDSMPEKNVWGNEDPMRREREQARMDSNDPLAAIKRGVRQLKATEQERKRWNDQRKKELEALKSEQRDSSSRHRRRTSKSIDTLEDFKLDSSGDKSHGRDRHQASHQHHHHHHHHHRHHRDRSRDRHGDRSSRRSHQSSDRSHRHRRDESRGSRHSLKPEKY
ncbi:hypothetical protein N7478_003696 [Penicillium angulare]|uniref:uncharacterized protein n=1 Tax=Penicillium angulare TaxID=116970 RepID=UPI0025402570|nr:uncharacterized protein N7478_003696 [Penicillium angulare]KAJ5288010.1 hypothetical protein N7478_003696 [Penicillium angulare]